MIFIETGNVFDASAPTALYENLLSEGTLSGTGSTGFEVGNAITGTTWDFWRPPSSAVASIQVVLTSAAVADCAAISAHDMFTNGASFRVQYSANGGTTWSNATDWITPTDNDDIMVLFPEFTGNAWRLQQQNGPASVAVILIGKKLAFDGGIDGARVGFAHGNRVEVMGGNSIGGQFLGQRVRRRGGNTRVTFPWLPSQFVDNTMAEFQVHYNDGRPFAFAGSPSYDRSDLAYCWRPDTGSELRPSYIQNGIAAEVNMELDYYVET